MPAVEAVPADYLQRFGGVERLYGRGALHRLSKAHVCVVGVGGVGSWTVEALARSGIGALTLIDLDDVCVTNVNRQLHALDGSIGQPKVDVLAARVRAINPNCRVQARSAFLTEASASELIEGQGYDYVVDAIDSLTNKCILIARACALGLRIATSGGAGGRSDPAKIKTDDLAFTIRDPLLRDVRKRLRQRHGFSRDLQQPFGVAAVYSTEPPVYPQGDGTVCAEPDAGTGTGINCDAGIGTASFVTGAFGFAAAAVVVTALAAGGSSK